MKLMTIVGTRPEMIKLSRLIPLLDENSEHIFVHTGQNFDYELNRIFYEDLNLREPDYLLDINTSSFGKAIGSIISKTEDILLQEQPDALIILGDTNSGLSSIVAKRLHIPIYHLEAGNRSFDLNVPEESNRKIIDHLADFNIVYTKRSKEHLIAEGYPHRRIYLSGSPMKEIYDFYRGQIEDSDVLNKLQLEEKKYMLLSAHREENVDDVHNLQQLLNSVSSSASEYKCPVICTTHPRTRKLLEKHDLTGKWSNIQFHKPFRFSDYIKLQKNAICTLSDSGTISEESAILGFPAITIRRSMERPEAMDHGTILMSGLNLKHIQECIRFMVKNYTQVTHQPPEEYMVTNFSDRVLKLIMSTYHLSNKWHGIQPIK